MERDKMFVKISGIGSYVPDKVVTNDDLSKIVDTSDEWIVSRSGIKERRIASKEQATSDLCINAARDAIKNAKLQPEDIDLILVGTVSPDMTFPSTAALVHKALGIKAIPCFDYMAACAGFQYGTRLVQSLLLSCSDYKNILLICGDKITSITDWTDRSTCVLFGDGAGAVVFSKTENAEENSVIDVLLGADGKFSELLELPAGGSREPITSENINSKRQYIKMAGRDVFREAVKTMCSCSQEILTKNGMTIADVDFLVPHQANLRIIEAIGERLEVPSEKVCITVDKFGNTSASSCIIALDYLIKNGRLNPGMKVLTVSFGAGLTWGTSILKF